MVTCTGHIGIHEGANGRTYGRTLYGGTDVDDVMAIKPNFLTSMGYHIFLTMVLCARISAINHYFFVTKKKKPVIFRKNRRMCGSAVTQHFIPYSPLWKIP